MALSLLDQEGSGQAIVARPAVGLSFTAGGGGGAGGLTDLASAALGIGGKPHSAAYGRKWVSITPVVVKPQARKLQNRM